MSYNVHLCDLISSQWAKARGKIEAGEASSLARSMFTVARSLNMLSTTSLSLHSLTHTDHYRCSPVKGCVGTSVFLKISSLSVVSCLLQPVQNRQEILFKSESEMYVIPVGLDR